MLQDNGTAEFPVKVLLVSPSLNLQGGVTNYARLLLANIDTTRVSMVHVHVGRESVSNTIFLRPLEYIASVWRFTNALLSIHPDVVHLNPSLTWQSLPLNLGLILLTKFLKRGPLLLFFHGWDEDIAFSMVNNDFKGWFLKLFLRQADFYLVLARSFRNSLIQAGFCADDIAITSMMVKSEYPCLIEMENTRSHKRAFKRTFNVLFLSRLSKDKGVWALAEAIDWWGEKYPDIPTSFTIAGDGPQANHLHTHFKHEITKGFVRMPGYIQGAEKWAFLKEADIFVFPSHYEGFPNVIVEALAAGLPIIYTPVGALNEILGPENGVRIELAQLSGEILGQKMWYLYQHPERRNSMAKANTRRVQEQYDVGVVCEQMANVYQYVAELA